MHLTEFDQVWLSHHGKTVKISGLEYKLNVKTMLCRYPYAHQSLSVYAEPVDREGDEYLATKRKLGDDWDLNVLDSDIELRADVLSQLGE
jgi:hypothetical protein